MQESLFLGTEASQQRLQRDDSIRFVPFPRTSVVPSRGPAFVPPLDDLSRVEWSSSHIKTVAGKLMDVAGCLRDDFPHQLCLITQHRISPYLRAVSQAYRT
jgi:hypothetical protein